RDGDRSARVDHLLAAHKTVGRAHGDTAHGVLAQMLRHLEHKAVAMIVRLKRVENRRQMLLELHVDDGADDLPDNARRAAGSGAERGHIRGGRWGGSLTRGSPGRSLGG